MDRRRRRFVASATAATLTFPMCFLGQCFACFSFGTVGTVPFAADKPRSALRPGGDGQPARKFVDEKCIFQAQTILWFATMGGSRIEVTYQRHG